MTHVKICCISSIEEAQLAIRYGAHALGLVSAMPSGPGVIDEATIGEVARSVPESIATFLLTSETTCEAIVEQHARCGTTTLQLCDRIAPEVHRGLRAELPNVTLVQVVHVREEASIDEAALAAQDVDALLLDSGNLTASVKELGGTGRTHDWSVSARIVEASPIPVYLAGGLGPANVAEAIRSVRPFGLDLCSGVRRDDALDEGALGRFMQAVAGADSR